MGFDVNAVALVVHSFALLLFVTHEYFRNLIQDINPWIFPARHSKLSLSLIPADAQSVERSVIGCL